MYSLYLHIPFCIHRCAYCDFNTYAGLESLIPAYVQALRREIMLAGRGASLDAEMAQVHTVFFGGGTPSLLPAGAVEELLATIGRSFDLQPGAEITLEANPGTLSLAYLESLRRAGVNRLSLGVQSANPGELRLLERQHDYPDVIAAVSQAKKAGFERINLDLIFGLPYQHMGSWQQTVELACGLDPEHLSLYALTLEHGTPMQAWVQRGLMAEPDGDLAADMYEWAGETLQRRGYAAYEISNWAKVRPDGSLAACQHNLQYWRGLPYLGLGAGAHGYVNGARTANVLSPQGYIQRMGEGSAQPFPRTPATAQAHAVSREEEMGEYMMMGLRLLEEGVSNRRFQERFAVGLEDAYHSQIARLCGLGLLEWDGDRLRLSARGRLLGNQVFVEFI